MCTALSISGEKNLFGRTFDLDRSYGERVVITPRNFGFSFLRDIADKDNMGIVGIGCTRGGFPLYYDGINEKGLGMAALNFPESAKYLPAESGKLNVASFELIPRVLGFCESLCDALELVEKMNITPDGFSEELPPTPLHWMLSQNGKTAVVEATEQGIKIYENALGVLTNEPPFPFQRAIASNFAALSPYPPKPKWNGEILKPYSGGTGAIGLPGDFSSSSRFVRAAYLRGTAAECKPDEEISRFFHIMGSVNIPEGCVINENGGAMTTRYTVCYDTAAFECFFTTQDCRRIRRISPTGLDDGNIAEFPIYRNEDIENITF